jgi:hypothetical protein
VVRGGEGWKGKNGGGVISQSIHLLSLPV